MDKIKETIQAMSEQDAALAASKLQEIMGSTLGTPELRLKCLEFVVNHHHGYNWPIYQMIEAEMIMRYITLGELPASSLEFANAKTSLHILLQEALKQLIKERDNSNKAANGSNADANNLKKPESKLARLLCFFRRE